MANTLCKMENYSKAKEYYLKAIKIAADLVGIDHPEYKRYKNK